MMIRPLLLSVALVACGGGSKKEPVAPTPTEPTPEPVTTPSQPEPPPPKLVLGDVKIVLKVKSKKESLTGEIAIASDGEIKATMIAGTGKKKRTTNRTGRLTVEGELFDDKDEVIAKITDDGTVTVRQVTEEKKDGEVVKSEVEMEAVGTLADDGVFTSKNDGKTFSIDDTGKVPGLGADLTVTTAAPEHKKAAMFVVIAMFAASKITTEMSSSSTKPAVAPK